MDGETDLNKKEHVRKMMNRAGVSSRQERRG